MKPQDWKWMLNTHPVSWSFIRPHPGWHQQLWPLSRDCVWTALCHPLLSKPYPSSSPFVQLKPCSKQTMFPGHGNKTVGKLVLQCLSASQNLTCAWLWDVPSSQYKHRKGVVSVTSVHFVCHFFGNFSADCIWDGTQPQKDGQDSA